MKKKETLMLDEEDEKIVRLFSELGMPKKLSKTLLYISQIDECHSADIEQAVDLRQPEVSTAMQELRRRGWVKKRDLKKEKKGKGRPVHIYKFTTNLSEIVKAFEKEKLKEIETIKSNLSELKSFVSSK